LAWALAEDPALSRVVGDWLDELATEGSAPWNSELTTNGSLLGHGVVSPALTAQLGALAQREIVIPCGRRLLEAAATGEQRLTSRQVHQP
jgi:hypothetical protein